MTQPSACFPPKSRDDGWRYRPHWSYSQIAQYLRCPLQFYFERVLKLTRRSVPSSMILGSAIHAGLAHYHEELRHGHLLKLETVNSKMLVALQAAEQEKSVDYKAGENMSTLAEQGSALLAIYLQEPPPDNVVAVEEAMLVPLVTSQGEILEKPLVVIVDLLSGGGGELLITEFKTSSRKYSDSDAESSLQATCYVHAVQERYDISAAVEYVVLVKTKKPAIQRITTGRLNEDLSRVGDIVQALEKALEAEVFYPIESPKNCSGCAFRKECREWKGASARLQASAIQ